MSFSLYDAVFPSNLQILRALGQVMAKAKSFCAERSSPEAEMIDARLARDMLPLGYQVKPCVMHSIGAVEGARTGGALARQGCLAHRLRGASRRPSTRQRRARCT
jgi:hypothetical protein